MRKAVIYIHGKGGNVGEAEHYKPLFPGYDVIGFDYKSETPWEAKDEFGLYFESASAEYESITLIANSIGAYYSLTAGIDKYTDRAFMISPVVDMEKLIKGMLNQSGYTESDLKEKRVIYTGSGDAVTIEYLKYVRSNPPKWKSGLFILYGSSDNLTSFETISEFAKNNNASLTVMDGGEHWFHTGRQMEFLDKWILSNIDKAED